MPIYAATIPGRNKRVLIKAENQTEAMKRFVTVEILTAEKMQDALDDNERVWKPGDDFPADEAATEGGQDEAEAE